MSDPMCPPLDWTQTDSETSFINEINKETQLNLTTTPTLSITRVADKLLLAQGTLEAMRKKIELPPINRMFPISEDDGKSNISRDRCVSQGNYPSSESAMSHDADVDAAGQIWYSAVAIPDHLQPNKVGAGSYSDMEVAFSMQSQGESVFSKKVLPCDVATGKYRHENNVQKMDLFPETATTFLQKYRRDSVEDRQPSPKSGLPSDTTVESHVKETTDDPKKGRPKYRTSRPPLLPPCRVCGDRASGFHYGVNTCEACKGFFRRSINKATPYMCVAEGHCKMVPFRRTACSACRFKRCLDVGMSKDAIKTGRYTHALRSKNILEVKQLQKQNNKTSSDNTASCQINAHASPEVELDNLNRTVTDPLKVRLLEETSQKFVDAQKFLYEFLDDYYKDDLILERQIAVYNRYMKEKMSRAKVNLANDIDGESHKTNIPGDSEGRSLIGQHLHQHSHQHTNVYDASRGKTRVSQNIIKCDLNQVRDSFITPDLQMSEHSFESKTMSIIDEERDSLLKRGGYASTATNATDNNFGAVKPDELPADASEETKATVLAQIITDMERGVQGMLSFVKCLPGFNNLPKEDQVCLVKAARFDIWFIGHIRCFNSELQVGACEWQFHADELGQVWSKELIDIAFRLANLGQRLKLTKEETAALRALSLSFSDRCYPLSDREGVELMHSNMLDVFMFVAGKRIKHVNLWFAEVVNFLCMLREFGILFEKISSCLKLDWAVLVKNPLLLEVFLS